ncbi:transketolase [Pendulispora albinea]|uniref:Transketolase n=1 Tax=Pendulispora albinea TaxID=2741071 RepID=A0ABZ2LR83_9BACT
MNNPSLDRDALAARARTIREHIVALCISPEGGHLGGALSLADILTVLYFSVLRVDPNDPAHPDRDIFILSKGHGVLALYATLAERGFFPVDELATFGQPGSRLMAHPVRAVPGIEMPTGSLGHGLSLALGFALASRDRDEARRRRVFCVLGDGELQEGSVWEAAMAAPSLRLDNLVAIVDRNGLQITGPTEQTVRLEPLVERWRSFGWMVHDVDGHDIDRLKDVLSSSQPPNTPGTPTVLVAKTVKGKGIAAVEGTLKSHFARLRKRVPVQ